MRLVQTLVVRDEVDIVDAQIAYHLNAGVDFVIATDHESRDGTTEVLESYARDGYLRRIPERGEIRESTWRTRMARLAATEHDADWVIHADADEFWLPRSGTLREALAAVPSSFGIVWALSRHFPPRPGDDDEVFAERMTVRVSLQAALNDPTSPYRPHAKVGHRADPEVVVRHGGHSAVSTRLRALPDWHVAEIFHFPYRTVAQYEQKGVRGAHVRSYTPLGQYVRASQASEAGRIGDRYAALVVDDETLERGCAEGSLVVDTRLRDTLRRVSAGQADTGAIRQFCVRHGDTAEPTRKSAESAGIDQALIAEGAALRDAGIVRLARSLDGVRSRLRRLEDARRLGYARAP